MSSLLDAARRPTRFALVLVAVVIAACTETSKESYQIQIKGPAKDFQGAATVSLFIGNMMVAQAPTTGGAFTLETKDLDPTVTKTGVVAVRVVDAQNQLLAFGQTPELEFLNGSTAITIFVQKPGTLAPGASLPVAIRDHVGITSTTLPGGQSQLRVSLPLFGLGRQRRLENGAFGPERLSNDFYVYNPFTHSAQNLVTIGDSLRAEVAGLAHASGHVYLFGGLAQSLTVGPTSRLDVFQLARSDLTSFAPTEIFPYSLAPAARRQAVLAAADHLAVAFGGLGDADTDVLDSVVILYPGSGSMPLSVPAPRMSAPRRGHTATPVMAGSAKVLVYGGAPPGGSVADLFDPLAMGGPTFPALPERPELLPAGTGRKDHAALEITIGAAAQKQVLIFGGVNDAGAPRADSLLFDPATLKFKPGPLQLKTPRSRFATFMIDKDLVVVGGIGADGKHLASAEIHDLGSLPDEKLPFVAELPALPRARATAGFLSNLSVAIIGGESADGSSSAVEIYQPRQPSSPAPR
jgi:hypothetical protein